MKYTTLTRLVLASLILVPTVGRALDAESLPKVGLFKPEVIAAHRGELGLSDDQTASLQGLVQAARQSAEPLETAVRNERQALEKLIRDSETKPDAASAQLTKLLDAEASVKQLQLRTLLGIRSLLTPEQRAKAVALAAKEPSGDRPLEARVKEKASRLKNAFESIGVPPASSLKEKGASIEASIKSGDLAAAEKALDALATEVGLDAPEPAKPDFSKGETGSTVIEDLKQRYDNVTEKARNVTRLPDLKQLLQARDELEKAKSEQDVERIGRILTFAEGIVGK